MALEAAVAETFSMLEFRKEESLKNVCNFDWEKFLGQCEIPTQQIRLEIQPHGEFLYDCFGTTELGEPFVFFERFLDDEFTLLSGNYWLRERIYNRENPYEIILPHVDDRPLADSMNVLSCRQWKTESSIEAELKRVFGKTLSSFQTVIATYNVFRYSLGDVATLDQAVLDISDLSTRHETLSIRFENPSELRTFCSKHEERILPNLSKVVASLKRHNDPAIEVLKKLKKETDLPLLAPVWCEPDLSKLGLCQEEEDM